MNFNFIYDQFRSTPGAILPKLYQQSNEKLSVSEVNTMVLEELKKIQQNTLTLYQRLDSNSQIKLNKKIDDVNAKLHQLNPNLEDENESAFTMAIVATIRLNRYCHALLNFEELLHKYCTGKRIPNLYHEYKKSILSFYALDALSYFSQKALKDIIPKHQAIIENFHFNFQKTSIQSKETESRTKLIFGEQVTRQLILTSRNFELERLKNAKHHYSKQKKEGLTIHRTPKIIQLPSLPDSPKKK